MILLRITGIVDALDSFFLNRLLSNISQNSLSQNHAYAKKQQVRDDSPQEQHRLALLVLRHHVPDNDIEQCSGDEREQAEKNAEGDLQHCRKERAEEER